MNTARQFCFTHPSLGDIWLFKLSNSKGTEVSISSYGAIITSFKLRQPNGGCNDIVLGFDSMEEYFSKKYLDGYPWMGCAIGRTANRTKNGVAIIDGKKYQLTQNKGDDNLHGGLTGFDKKNWEFVSLADSPHATLVLKYRSVDGEEGYPGNLDVFIQFELTEENELSYEFRATTDQSTPVNLTHHSYFNLNNGQGTNENHQIRIPASVILGQDDGLVADGKLIPVAGSIFDFREFKLIGKKWDDKELFDQSFVIDDKNRELSLVAEAVTVESTTHLKVYSTEPVVHFYSGKWIPEIKGKNGIYYRACSGFCLETHVHPNATNVAAFPDTVLRPGEEYFHKTVYKVIA